MTSLTLAFLMTLLSAGLALALARLVEARFPARHSVPLWRAARLAALSPVAIAGLGWMASLAPAPARGEPWPSAGDGSMPLALLDFTPVMAAMSESAAALPGWLVPGAGLVYAAGLTVSVSRMVARRRALRRLLAAARPAGPGLSRIAQRWRERLDLPDDTGPVCVIDAAVSPFVAGVRPVIVAPETLETSPSAEFAIAHEVMHIRRGDEQDRVIGEILAAVFWFNPLVRAVERRLAGARELACDGDLLAFFDRAQARCYAAAIADAAPAAPASAFLSDLRDLRRRRIEAVLHPAQRPARGVTLAAAAGLLIAAGGPASGVALALNGGAGPDDATVRQVSPQTLSAPVGEAVLRIQEHLQVGDQQGVLARTGPLLERDLSAYERSVVLRLEAASLFGLDRYAQSAARFEQAIETGALTAHDEGGVHLNVLQLHAVLENFDQAADHADQMLALGYDLPDFQKITVAQVYSQAGRHEDALPLAEEGIAAQETPSAVQLLFLEHLYQELGREADRARVQARREALEDE